MILSVLREIKEGALDACQISQAVIIMLSSRKVQIATLKCFVLNGVLLLGSIILFEYCIMGALDAIFERAKTTVVYSGMPQDVSGWVQTLGHAHATLNVLLNVIYRLFWEFPLFGLSFLFNAMWYQEIADRTFEIQSVCQEDRQQRRKPDAPDLKPPKDRKNADGGLSGSLVVRKIVDHVYRLLFGVVYLTIATAVASLTPWWFGTPVSFVLFCWLYSLYTFEYKWTGQGVPVSGQLRRVEDRWAYFLGFGLPLTAVTIAWSTIVSSAIFALLFPLFIIMATTTCSSPQEASTGARQDKARLSTVDKEIPPRLPLFSVTTRICDFLIARALLARRRNPPGAVSNQDKRQ